MTMPADWKPDPAKVALGEERILWKREVDVGTIRRNVADVFLITSHKVSRNYASIPLQDVDDIVVMNRFRQSSTRGEISEKHEIRLGSEGVTIGDVVFMVNGKIALSFPELDDPDGVAALARAARDNAREALKSIPSEKRQVVTCPRCNTANSPERKVCAGCGLGLAFLCTKCGRSSPEGSLFCGHCGTRL
jgi:hypothetical protein